MKQTIKLNMYRHLILTALCTAVGTALMLSPTTATAVATPDAYTILPQQEKGICTRELQAAIDACHGTGGGFVRIAAGRYLTGTIRLKSGVHLMLDPGAVLLGSQSLDDYDKEIAGNIEAPSFSRCLIYAEDASDIGLQGPGSVDGQGDPKVYHYSHDPKHVPERPTLIRLVNCKNVRFSQISLRNAAAWCCHLLGCERVWIDRCSIDSHLNGNNDGFDIDTCRDVSIRDCLLNTGDDAICLKSTRLQPSENLVISGCNITSKTAGVKLGTSSAGGFRNILVQDCIFRHCGMGTLKVLCVDGGHLESVHFSNLIMDECEGPIFVRLGSRGVVFDRPKEIVYDRADVKEKPAPVGTLRDCSFRNIRATVRTNDPARAGIMITGIPGACVENIRFENVEITRPGGGTEADAARKVPEDERRYPERFFFGTIPSSAVFVRHARNVSFANVQITLQQPDGRSPFHCEDVEQIAVERSGWRTSPETRFQPISLK